MPKNEPRNLGVPQSPEYSLAKPSRPEVPAPLELTEEEDKHLLDLLNRAKEAKAEGDLKGAIELLSSYKEEYSRLRKERSELINLVKTAFVKEAEKEGKESEGILFGDQAKEDLSGTQSALQNPRPP